MEEKIKKLLDKLLEIEKKLQDPEIFADQKLYKELSQEHARLSELRDTWDYYLKTFKELSENKELLLTEKDPELIQVIKDELENLQRELDITKARLEIILVPPDPRDKRFSVLRHYNNHFVCFGLFLCNNFSSSKQTLNEVPLET